MALGQTGAERRAIIGLALGALAGAWAPRPAAAKKNDWIPPGLSTEERAEWAEGRPPGWSHGKKKGWRGGHCPPGQAKKGRCGETAQVIVVPAGRPPTWIDELQAALERLRRWALGLGLIASIVAAILAAFEGLVRAGLPFAEAERTVKHLAEQRVAAPGIEMITRAIAYGAERGAPLPDLEQFVQHGLRGGAAVDAIALGVYRKASEARR